MEFRGGGEGGGITHCFSLSLSLSPSFPILSFTILSLPPFAVLLESLEEAYKHTHSLSKKNVLYSTNTHTDIANA